MRRKSVWLALGVLGVLCAAPAALASGAAPTYVTSDPQNGATVQEGPSRVSVTFSEPLDAGSSLQVFDECGRGIDADDEQVLGSRIDVGLALIPSGKYTAVYTARGFGGATGETKGSFSFNVTSGIPCGGEEHHHHHGGGGGDDGGGHDGHGGGSGHSGHGGDGEGHHSGTGSEHATHDGEGHTSHDSSSHGGHDGATHGDSGHDEGHGAHSGNAHHDGRGGHSGGGRSDGAGGTELAAGRGGLGLAPTSTSVVIALALSIGMGALGGWVLRVSARS